MTELLEAKPGTVSKLLNPNLEDARQHADAILAGELFRCFGAYREPLKPNALNLISAISNMALMPIDGDYTIKAGDEHKKLLGFDVIKGKPEPDDGTTYERPIAAGVDDEDSRRVIGGKSFAYIPLDDTIEIGIGPEQRQDVSPGHMFLSEPGAMHTVHIPSGLVAVELVLAGWEADSPRDGWLHYLHSQPNPNATKI